MKSYRVTKSPLVLSSGAVVGLTPQQESPRRAALVPLGKDLYRVLSVVQFKAGESVVLDEDTAKALCAFVESAEEEPKAISIDLKATGGKKLAAELQRATDAVQVLRAENAALSEEIVRLRADLDAATAPPVATAPTGDGGGAPSDDLPPAS
ncbi:hypothetical protein H261_03248 [Paramagnetospirillum caucaseum]|uniref:Uncharacterized protein n=1 Tax=Paramagnetospirillum caucaseum TaxID=1244869 RepID=M2ZVG6_9PROT|nr:hypothetical protein [Paramagnetospirillum caucaseum]EME71392.1 hypothetical protein H261_03248 [Paramagnetospirillum caucaseum]